MKKILSTFVICMLALVAHAKIERPKLVVGIVVDQMRWDYLYYYHDQFGAGGLRRLLDDGFSCENTMINYVPTVTAIGHSSVYTGSVPSLTGIAGNNLMIDGKWKYCCEDSTVSSVGSHSKAGQMSPRNLLATTIGDQLKLATDFKSKVIGIALKDRAAILPAGHMADAAYWWDQSAGNYVSSTYYMNELPKWVQQFNKQNKTKPGYDIKMDPKGVTMTFKLAEAAIENEALGRHDVTDMLCVSISSTDVIGHKYGTRGKENHAVYMQLDKDIAHFFQVLDEKVGKGNYLLFLTADHAAIHNPNFLRAHKMDVNGWNAKQTCKDLNAHLTQKFGALPNDAPYVLRTSSTFIYFNKKAIGEASTSFDDVKAEAVNFLKQDPQYLYVVDLEKAVTAPIPLPIRERLVNGYFRGRSGDVAVVLRSGDFEWTFDDKFTGTTHGQWNPYDSHIPLVFMGWNVDNGATNKPTYIVDIAATVCAMLHIQMPNACIGNAIDIKD